MHSIVVGHKPHADQDSDYFVWKIKTKQDLLGGHTTPDQEKNDTHDIHNKKYRIIFGSKNSE